MAGWIKMPLGMEVGVGPAEFVLDGDPPLPKKGTSPQFSTHARCGKTAEWTKMPLGMEEGLSSGDSVLDGTELSPKGARPPPPIFNPRLPWPNGLMHQYGNSNRNSRREEVTSRA